MYDDTLKVNPLSSQLLKQHTAKDPVLTTVGKYIQFGWPKQLKSNERHLQSYFNRRHCLNKYQGTILLNSSYPRVVIPLALQDKTLRILHEGHWGSSRAKQLARRHVWFPGLEKQIETMTSGCEICQQEAADPKKEFTSWPIAQKPWSRVHIDFAGPLHGLMCLICVDAYSKFPYIASMSSATSEARH